MTQKELQQILAEHAKWLRGEGGTRAVLRDAVLRDAVLRDADLTRADLTRADLTRAVLTRAVLTDAVLTDADLTRAVLTRADLTRADLTRAVLRDAVLRDADLTDADLTRADLTRAVLRDADLTRADLTRADLTRADLTRADLARAVLRDAVLRDVKEDVRKILSGAPHEAPAVLAVLREGRVDGSTYSGECACLIGTIANARSGARLEAVKAELNASPLRPAEMFFSAIRAGDTPATNPVSAIAAEWVEEWLKENPTQSTQGGA